ncbi:unnamed protein product, partial [Ectocarpus sp. 12 AP-2014]
AFSCRSSEDGGHRGALLVWGWSCWTSLRCVFVFGQVGTRRRLSACSKTPWCQDEVLGARNR